MWAGLGVIGALLATTSPRAHRPPRVYVIPSAALRGGARSGSSTPSGRTWARRSRLDVLLAPRRGGHRPRAALPERGRVGLLLERRPAGPGAAVPRRRGRRRRFPALRGRPDERGVAQRWLRVSVAATAGIGALCVGGLVLPAGAADLARLRRASSRGRPAAHPGACDGLDGGRERPRLLPHRDGVARVPDLAAGPPSRRRHRAFHETAEQVAVVALGVGGLVAFLQYQAAASICRWRPPLEPSPSGAAFPARAAGDARSLGRPPVPQRRPGLRAVVERLLEQLPGGRLLRAHRRLRRQHRRDGRDAASLASERRPGHRTTRSARARATRSGSDSRRRGASTSRSATPTATSPPRRSALPRADAAVRPGRRARLEAPPAVRRLLPAAAPPAELDYHKLTRLLFRVNVRDTQTGLKLIRRDVLAAVLPRMLEKRYAFDLEFLVVARSLGFARVFEAPVRIDYRFASHVNLRSLGIVRDTLAIFYRHHILDTYRGAGALAEQMPPAAPFFAAERRRRGPGTSPRACPDPLHQLARRGEPGRRGREVVTHEVAKRWVAQGNDVTQLSSGFPGAPPRRADRRRARPAARTPPHGLVPPARPARARAPAGLRRGGREREHDPVPDPALAAPASHHRAAVPSARGRRLGRGVLQAARVGRPPARARLLQLYRETPGRRRVALDSRRPRRSSVSRT